MAQQNAATDINTLLLILHAVLSWLLEYPLPQCVHVASPASRARGLHSSARWL
jgi:hypothetical protein